MSKLFEEIFDHWLWIDRLASIFITIAILAVVFFAGLVVYNMLRDPAISEGYVVEKRYVPEHTIMIPQTVGKNTYLQNVHVPDKWYVKIEGTDQYGEVHEEVLPVTKEHYNRTEVGDWWTIRAERP